MASSEGTTPSPGPDGDVTSAFPSLVSVIIPARNAARLLPEQLAALSRQDYTGSWEVVVADNGSTDGTAAVAEAWAGRLPELRTVSAHGRQGINHARNAGARVARGDLLLFCDADDVASPGWLKAMAVAARRADLVGGYPDHDRLNTPRASHWRGPPPADRLPVMMRYLPYAVGASLGVRAPVFHALGGFDEEYVFGCDEVGFSWRAQLGGYTISFAPDAVMFYRLRDRWWPLVRQAYAYGRATAHLMRDFRSHGVPPVTLRTAARKWLQLLTGLPHLASRDEAGTWLFAAAWRAGRLVGSIRYRVMCL